MFKDDILATLRAHREELRVKYNVTSLALFGSVARGDENLDSDIDILFEVERPFTMFDWVSLELYLTNLIGKKVDLILKRSLKNRIKEKILAEKVDV